MNYRFYLRESRPGAGVPPLARGAIFRQWSPSRHGFPPPGPWRATNSLWWGLDRLAGFGDDGFAELTIEREGVVLHRLIVTPRWYRFAFMAEGDYQLGDLWTQPAARGQGLARTAMAEAHRRFAGRAKRFWYVVAEDNQPSIRLADAMGYRLAGTGCRTAPLGIRLLGRFRLDRPVASAAGSRSGSPLPTGQRPNRSAEA